LEARVIRLRGGKIGLVCEAGSQASEALGFTVTAAARAFGVSRRTLSAIVNGRTGISPEMAVRLSLGFDTTAESWLAQQVQHDLWRAETGSIPCRTGRACGPRSRAVSRRWRC
jgi:addiction module HigA family antidote